MYIPDLVRKACLWISGGLNVYFCRHGNLLSTGRGWGGPDDHPRASLAPGLPREAVWTSVWFCRWGGKLGSARCPGAVGELTGDAPGPQHVGQ